MRGLLVCTMLLVVAQVSGSAQAQKPYRLPDLGERFKDRIIWGSQAESADGFTLAFGGQDQDSDDGIGHTRIKEKGGEWISMEETLDKGGGYFHALSKSRRKIGESLRTTQAALRSAYFEQDGKRLRGHAAEIERTLKPIAAGLKIGELNAAFVGDDPRYAEIRSASGRHLEDFDDTTEAIVTSLKRSEPVPGVLRQFDRLCQSLQSAAIVYGAEPPPRALSQIVYEPKSGLFFVFGGDHFDYLMNDVWAFDPKEKRWSIRLQIKAPPPRANHTLKATGDGKIVMTGGYTYSSSTGYISGQYIDLDDGEWVYDVAKNTWTGQGEMVDSMSRTYRTGPFHPEFYYEPQPDRAAHTKVLESLPVNQWVNMNPPKLPRLNRDWGSAVLDPDRDLILRYSGGHSAHGGTDVLHYHIATNRWELCYPVEFPLGQLYANTRYPNGFNFNGRPWITGHTYQNYGYDPHLKKMLFSGRPEYTYIYDVDRGDWDGRFRKPNGMIYNSCFYTLTHCTTPTGLVCWTKNRNSLWFFSAEDMEWHGLAIDRGELPGAVVDNSTVVYDSKRDRLLFFVKGYGKDRQYDGQIHAYEFDTGHVTQLSPKGMEAAHEIPYLCQIRYDEANDLLLVGGTLPPGEDGLRRTPAYDPVKNEWISLKITGDDPSGERGRNVSLGMMYDPKRKLFLAVDTNSQVFALKLEPDSAVRQPLGK